MNISKLKNNCCCFCTAPERNEPTTTSAGVLKGLELIYKLLEIPLEKKSESYPICKDCGDCLSQIYEFQLEIQVLQLKTEDKIKDIQIAILENRNTVTTGSSRQSSNAAADSQLATIFVEKCKKFRKNSAVSVSAISPTLSTSQTAGLDIRNGNVGEGDSQDLLDDVRNGEQDQVEYTSDSSQDAFSFLEAGPEVDEFEEEVNIEDILQPTPPAKSSNKWITPSTPGRCQNGKSRGRNQETKKMKQQTLISMSKNFPKQTVDISTLKEFQGGSRPTTGDNAYPVKRKSDEMNHESPVKLIQDMVPVPDPDLEDPDLTVFEPPPELGFFARTPNEPVVHTSRQTETLSKLPDYGIPDEACPEPEPAAYSRPKFNFKSKTNTKNLNSTEELIKDFDKIPERIKVDTFGKPVRKKEERAKLSGWACDMCRKYYEALNSQMHPSEIQRLKDQCSRHRSDRPMDLNNTPVEYWTTKLPTTQEAYAQGYIKVGIASPPVRKRRNDLLDDDN